MSRYRWTILALGTIGQASYSAVFLGIPVLAPQFRDEYGLSLTEIGVVLAAFSVGSVLTLLPWGLLTDRVGERSVLAAGLALASVALALARSLSVRKRCCCAVSGRTANAKVFWNPSGGSHRAP